MLSPSGMAGLLIDQVCATSVSGFEVMGGMQREVREK
jgi:hypothetical protein